MATKEEITIEKNIALAKRNTELRYLRRLVFQLKQRIRELESHTTTHAADDGYCPGHEKHPVTIQFIGGKWICNSCSRPRR